MAYDDYLSWHEVFVSLHKS